MRGLQRLGSSGEWGLDGPHLVRVIFACLRVVSCEDSWLVVCDCPSPSVCTCCSVCWDRGLGWGVFNMISGSEPSMWGMREGLSLEPIPECCSSWWSLLSIITWPGDDAFMEERKCQCGCTVPCGVFMHPLHDAWYLNMYICLVIMVY